MRKATHPRDRFIRLDHALLTSEAWFHLTPSAGKLLLAVWTRYDGQNNGHISYSRREARDLLGCGPNQAKRAFDELIEKGFLVCTKDADFAKKTAKARLWRITALPTADGQPTRDFETWRPGDGEGVA